MTRLRPLLVFVLMPALMLAACKREAPATATPVATHPGAPAVATTPPPLQDVVETTPRYIIGIIYPKSAAKYPGLASALQDYAVE